MKKSILALLAAFTLASTLASAPIARADDWKGKPENSSFDVGGLAGLSNVQGAQGFGVMGTFARKIVNQGFVPDLNDTVSLELEMGPHFRSGANAGVYALQLRWDFQKDEIWTVYAVGGIHGNFSGDAYLHSFDLYPRFAAGVMLSPKKESVIRFRAEVSHELIGVGVNIPLFL